MQPLEQDQAPTNRASAHRDWGACALWASPCLCMTLSLGEKQLEEWDTRVTRAQTYAKVSVS